jgi:hypothetical protein
MISFPKLPELDISEFPLVSNGFLARSSPPCVMKVQSQQFLAHISGSKVGFQASNLYGLFPQYHEGTR